MEPEVINTSTALDTPACDSANNNPKHTMESDHPDGEAIRRQVEFYFSDENLPTDLHLLKCCGGRNNDPVSINRICGFKKMRSYKPRKLVVEALRKSAFLEVSADGKMVSRKVPLQGKCLLDPDFLGEDDIAHDPRVRVPAVHPVQQLPQIKTVYPPGMSKNMAKPTGFEENYVEAPIKPQEAAEEATMYDPNKLFVERVELAIQRFKQKRRMHEMYAIVFNKMMRFGGVEQSPRISQGISKQDLAEMDAEELARALATHNVPWDRSDEKKWIVDFEGIAKSFLSSWYPAHYGYGPNAIKNACQVPRSFYNYLRYHNVCPEYDEQLARALRICDLAEEELPKANAAGLALPGDFNKSASVLFGGAHAGLYTSDKSWTEHMRQEGIKIDEVGIREEEARVKFITGIGIMGSDEQYKRLESQKFKVDAIESTGLEVIGIQLPTASTRSAYAEQNQYWQHKLGQLEPLGKLICKAWQAGDCDEWDLPKDRYPDGTPQRITEDKEFQFWMEKSVLEECFVGLKIHATILILEGGLTILDEAKEAMCSFFTWLPNELWMDRKPKEVRWLEKGREEDYERKKRESDEKDQDREVFDDEFDDE